MSKSFQFEGIGVVDVEENSEEFSLKIELKDMHISKDIKFYSPQLLNGFFEDISETNVREIALSAMRNKIELSARMVSLQRTK